jgi:hypothetical protein
MMTNQCFRCLNLFNITNTLTCSAFPDGIPVDILTGMVDHTEPYKNDKGIRFKTVE